MEKAVVKPVVWLEKPAVGLAFTVIVVEEVELPAAFVTVKVAVKMPAVE